MTVPQRSVVVQLSRAEYDVYSREELENELQAISPECTAVDFRNVHYIDSSCLTELIRAVKRLKSDDSDLTITIVNLDPQVRRIFELTQLSRYFNIP